MLSPSTSVRSFMIVMTRKNNVAKVVMKTIAGLQGKFVSQASDFYWRKKLTILCTNTTFEIPKNAISTKTKDSNQDMYVLLMCSILCHLRLLSALDFHESVTLFPCNLFQFKSKSVCVYIWRYKNL